MPTTVFLRLRLHDRTNDIVLTYLRCATLKFDERAPVHGTACQQNWSWCVPHRFSRVPWKRSCSRLFTT